MRKGTDYFLTKQVDTIIRVCLILDFLPNHSSFMDFSLLLMTWLDCHAHTLRILLLSACVAFSARGSGGFSRRISK